MCSGKFNQCVSSCFSLPVGILNLSENVSPEACVCLSVAQFQGCQSKTCQPSVSVVLGEALQPGPPSRPVVASCA